MIHPKTELKFINNEVGYGVFATEFIPKGTITWVLDKLDRVLSSSEFESMDSMQREALETYLFRNSSGSYVLCWDIERYVNHSFHSNCLSTAYNFEIAIKDIQAGEQLTDDYGYLNIVEPFCPYEEKSDRKMVYPDDLLRYSDIWDDTLQRVFTFITEVNQPLIALIAEDVWRDIILVSKKEKRMESIKNNYYHDEKYHNQ